MAARRCSVCGVNWPLEHMTCAECGEKTWYAGEADAMSVKDANQRIAFLKERAERIAKHQADYDEFERYYADREAAKLLEELDSVQLC